MTLKMINHIVQTFTSLFEEIVQNYKTLLAMDGIYLRLNEVLA